MFGLSPGHLVLLFIIVLLVFGPKSIPRIGQALGKGIREFKDATRGLTDDVEPDDRRTTSVQAQPTPLPPPAAVPPVAPPSVAEEKTVPPANPTAHV